MTQSIRSFIISEISLKGPINLIIDHPERVKLANSCYSRMIHWNKKGQLDEQVSRAINRFLQQRYHISDSRDFESIWKKIGASIWTPSTLLTVDILRRIDQTFKEQLVYHGSGMPAPPQNEVHSNPAIQKIANGLLHGGSFSLDLIQKPVLKALLVKKSPAWLKQFQNELQYELVHLANNPPKTDSDAIIWRTFLGNIIAIIPYAYPEDNEIISIPILHKNGLCEMIDYRVNVLKLTPASFSTPISAIGLTPISSNNASPIISFLGTTFPAGDGFAATIMADFTPGKSVGKAVYESGKEQVDAWMKDKNNVSVTGMSLGGALAFHTLLHHASKLSRLDVYNPPGLYKECWNQQKFDHGCDINIFCQTGDLVSKMGFWPIGKKVTLYHILPHQYGVSEGIAASHARAFTGCSKVTILKMNSEQINQHIDRKTLTKIHRILGPWIFYLPTTLFLSVCRKLAVVSRRSSDFLKKLKP